MGHPKAFFGITARPPTDANRIRQNWLTLQLLEL
jgi:hypothetical protein